MTQTITQILEFLEEATPENGWTADGVAMMQAIREHMVTVRNDTLDECMYRLNHDWATDDDTFPMDYLLDRLSDLKFHRDNDFEFRLVHEIAMIADELAFWKHQAIWYCAARLASLSNTAHQDNIKEAEQTLEKARQQENRGRYNVQPSHEIGS